MKKVFKSEAEVIDLIDKYHDQIKETLTEIESTNHLADMLRNTKESHRIQGLRNDVETMQREIEWRTGRLETLKEILAELRTLLLPFTSGKNDLELPGEVPAAVLQVCDLCHDDNAILDCKIVGNQTLCKKCSSLHG